jgi:peptidoglycan/LPS O-acetylase OafA/YrhL
VGGATFQDPSICAYCHRIRCFDRDPRCGANMCLVRCIAGFFIGCLTAVLFEFTNYRFARRPPLIAASAILLFLIVKVNPAFDPVIYLLSALLILAIVLTDGGKLILQARWLVWLGTISYSLYMSHWLIIWLWVRSSSNRLFGPSLTP